jgi:transcription elongation GreA/GreB family factor
MKPWSKIELRDELLESLREQLTVAERAHNSSIEGATHEEARPENEKDTRALEQSYLARGQAQRLVELKEAVALVQAMPMGAQSGDMRCSLGSIVEADDDGKRQIYWIVSAGGGMKLATGAIQVLTPQSPLGRALIGCRVDDDCEVSIGGRVRVLSIAAVL